MKLKTNTGCALRSPCFIDLNLLDPVLAGPRTCWTPHFEVVVLDQPPPNTRTSSYSLTTYGPVWLAVLTMSVCARPGEPRPSNFEK